MNSDKVSYYGTKEGQVSLGSLEADLRGNVHKLVDEILYAKNDRSESDTSSVRE